jgi:two-component system sensor histidine kinase/response regulator
MTAIKPKILIVDDEEQNLVSFKASFRRIYHVYTAQSADEGMQVLRTENGICVVVSDHRMPGKTGVKFLEDVKQEFHNIIRIVLTAYADPEATRDAINKAGVYRYLNKPWVEQDLLSTLNSAVELYNTREELIHKQEELEQAYAELSKFVYSASHDLRAPLVSVIGLINVAKMDPEFPKDSMYLPLIEKSVLKLEVFVRNIIEYYQNKERKKSMVPVNIAFMVEEIVHSLEYFQNASEIHYIKQFDLEIVTVTDEFRLKVILNNLISNAIKYQREDEANKQIRISAKSNSEQIILEVSDNGIGIKSSSKEHIFDMFYRATNQESGSGIGLYILKDAVNKLGGQISFESETGVGTTFKVMIPNNPTTNL